MFVALLAVFTYAATAAFAVTDPPVYVGEFGSNIALRPSAASCGPDGSLWLNSFARKDNPDGSYVYSQSNVVHFSATGELLGKWGLDTSMTIRPMDVSAAADGSVYVADATNNAIVNMSASGEVLSTWPVHTGTPSDGLRFVTVAPDGTVYAGVQTLEFGDISYRVEHFSATGDYLGDWVARTDQIGSAFDIAAAPDGSLYFADADGGRLAHFSAAGEFLGTVGSPGNGDGQLGVPMGIAFGADGSIYVGDGGLQRVMHFSADGAYLGKWTCFNTSIAVAPDNTVYLPWGDLFNQTSRVRYYRYPPSDTAAPATVISGGPFGSWARTPVSFSLSATDEPDGSGVAATHYALNGGDTQEYSGPVTVSADGTTTVSYWSVDDAGNVEPAHEAVILVDATAPTVTIASPVDGGAYTLNQSATANWSATDALSGIASASGSVANGGALDTSTAGTHTVTVTATDAAGNTTNATATYMVMAPTNQQLFADLLGFYDAGVANGTIVGTGCNPQMSLWWFRLTLVMASSNYSRYLSTGNPCYLSAAKSGLASAYSYSDGRWCPGDLVAGSNRAALNERIGALRTALSQ